MGDMIKMVIVLTVLASFSGGLLAAVRNGTAEQIEVQQLNFVKGPAISTIMEGAENDPITDRFKLQVEDAEKSFFVGKFDGEAKVVALEGYGKGYGGDVGLMVGINTEDDTLLGVWVTTHAETPGLGARAKDDPSFVSQLAGLSIEDPIELGGPISSIGGATITSKAVCDAATQAAGIYKENKDQILEQMGSF